MKKILFIAETSSIHAAKWINQLKGTDWDVYVFQPQMKIRAIHPEFQPTKFFFPFRIKTKQTIVRSFLPFDWGIANAIWSASLVKKLFPHAYTKFLVKTIRDLEPDIIHSLGLNVNWTNICSIMFEAKKALGRKFKTPWVYSTWGSDLDYYARIDKNNYKEVSKIMRQCDYQLAECKRDKDLARKMGFKGEFLGNFPGGGGLVKSQITKHKSLLPPSKRKNILIKGRDNNCPNCDPIGRAMVALKAIELSQDYLKGYHIYIFQPSENVSQYVQKLQRETDLDITLLPFVSYDKLLSIMGKSRLFISITINDGLPNSLVEAMTLGVFPIHSNLDSLDEWIRHNKTGLLVPPEDINKTAKAIQKALGDDNLVDIAQRLNADLVDAKLTNQVVRPRVLTMYEEILKKEGK